MWYKINQERITNKLINYINDLQFNDIPIETIDRTKDLMIDFLRLAVMGSRLPWSIQAHDVVEDLGGKEECTVIGHPNITNSPNAAFLNGVFSHGLEWDDIHSPAILHPGVVIFPTALAMGEKFNINGETFITACVAGYEAMVTN